MSSYPFYDVAFNHATLGIVIDDRSVGVTVTQVAPALRGRVGMGGCECGYGWGCRRGRGCAVQRSAVQRSTAPCSAHTLTHPRAHAHSCISAAHTHTHTHTRTHPHTSTHARTQSHLQVEVGDSVVGVNGTSLAAAYRCRWRPKI